MRSVQYSVVVYEEDVEETVGVIPSFWTKNVQGKCFTYYPPGRNPTAAIKEGRKPDFEKWQLCPIRVLGNYGYYLSHTSVACIET
jgi:hypothetical protein